MVAVADRLVERGQLRRRGDDLLGRRCNQPLSSELDQEAWVFQAPQFKAAVWTGASHSANIRSSTAETVSDAPAISRDVT